MAALTGNSIDSSYQGLLKTTDNGAVGGSSKAITDGLGNATNIEIGNAVTKFPSGTVDFTGSSVLGLPGGSAGLVSGAGADSMVSAASLTTTPAAAAGTDSIALGDSASASRPNSIAIGLDATADGSGSDGSIAIGKNASASANKSIAIGVNGTTNSAEGIAIGDNVDISSGADRVIAMGNSINVTNTSADDSIVIGTQTSSTARRGIALGFDATASAEDAVAIGYQVTAAKTDTVSVQALETQTNSTPTAGGIIMSDAGGTERRLNIDASGALQIDSTPVGGGGGGNAESFGQNITAALGGSNQIYSIPWTLSGYSKTNGRSMTQNGVQFVPFFAKAGETLDDFYIRVQTAQAGATMNIGLYKSYVATVQTNQKVTMPEYVATIATGVDVSTTGKKSFTGLAQSLPADAVGGQYWVGFQSDTAGVRLTKWSNWVAQEQVIYADIYRGNGLDLAQGSFALPTGQVSLLGASASTDLPLDFAWTYQS